MLLFYGTRATKLWEGKLRAGSTTCPHCESQNSFNITIYARYFHFFWIPIFPLSKKSIIECSHCKKTYDQDDLPAHLQQVLEKQNDINPVKRPFWHSCGCLFISVVFIIPFIFSMFFGILKSCSNAFDDSSDSEQTEQFEDMREKYLEEDMDKMTTSPTYETDSISSTLKSCVALSIDGIKTDKIKYFSKIKDDNILVLLKVEDMKKIKSSSRKILVEAVESCLDVYLKKRYNYYVGVEGFWNMLLVSTPSESDLGGRFADKNLLLEFYNEELKLKATTKDTIQ